MHDDRKCGNGHENEKKRECGYEYKDKDEPETEKAVRAAGNPDLGMNLTMNVKKNATMKTNAMLQMERKC
jgi:hypothetical protein